MKDLTDSPALSLGPAELEETAVQIGSFREVVKSFKMSHFIFLLYFILALQQCSYSFLKQIVMGKFV